MTIVSTRDLKFLDSSGLVRFSEQVVTHLKEIHTEVDFVARPKNINVNKVGI